MTTRISDLPEDLHAACREWARQTAEIPDEECEVQPGHCRNCGHLIDSLPCENCGH